MKRPYVTMNMAMTADGKITSAAREKPAFSSRQDKKMMDKYRAEADAVLVGAGTLRADDPPLHVRDREMQEYRAALGKPAALLNVLVTASASIDPGSRFFKEGLSSGRIVATVEDADPERLARLRAVAEVWSIGRGTVALPPLLERLAS